MAWSLNSRRRPRRKSSGRNSRGAYQVLIQLWKLVPQRTRSGPLSRAVKPAKTVPGSASTLCITATASSGSKVSACSTQMIGAMASCTPRFSPPPVHGCCAGQHAARRLPQWRWRRRCCRHPRPPPPPAVVRALRASATAVAPCGLVEHRDDDGDPSHRFELSALAPFPKSAVGQEPFPRRKISGCIGPVRRSSRDTCHWARRAQSGRWATSGKSVGFGPKSSSLVFGGPDRGSSALWVQAAYARF